MKLPAVTTVPPLCKMRNNRRFQCDKIIVGDNLKLLSAIPDGCIDLVATDPPYMTGRDFGAYNDQWKSVNAFTDFMEVRARELWRVLKPTGSLYLQCDPTASHYLKCMLDRVFGMDNFVNEIIWRCTTGVSGFKTQANRWIRNHDCILYYAKDNKRRYFEKAYRPHTAKNLLRTDRAPNAKGTRIDDCWIDIGSIQQCASSNEKTGYPTQKPLSLYARIVNASSNAGDVVLDPFCGSGTTLVAAARARRRYIGMDISNDAANIARRRLNSLKGELL